MLTRECHFGNDKVDVDQTKQRAGDTNKQQSTTSAPKVTAAASNSFGSRLPASQIPAPPKDAHITASSTTKTALPDGSTAMSSFYMSSTPVEEDMQSSDSMPDPMHNSLAFAPSRHYRIRADLDDEKDNMIPRPDKTRYHNFPYPHYHVYYDQPRLRDRIFARRWKQEYAKVLRQQEAAKEAEKAKPKKHSNSEEEDDENDNDPLAAAPPVTGPLATAPDTSVDYTSQEKMEAGEQRSRQRRSRYGMYNNDNVDDNAIDQLTLPSTSADGQWARYVTNSHSYHSANNPQGTSPKNIEYSYYREVNGPSSTTSATPYASSGAVQLDDYQNQIGLSPETSSKHEPEGGYADETRSDRSSAPLNDDDYGDDDGEGGGHSEGTHDDGNDDYGGGGGDDGSYDDSSHDGSPAYQGQGDGDGEQQDDNDDFFA